MIGKILPKIISWLIIGFVFLIPLFFLPFTADLYEFNKNILLLVITGILLILWLLKMALSGKFVFQKTWLDLPILIFAGTFVLSTVINAANKWETLWLPGSTGTIIFLTLFYFLLTNNLKENYVSKCLKALSISASLLALLTIYQFISLKIGNSFLFPTFIKTLTPAGSLIPLVTFLLTVLALDGTRIYFESSRNKVLPKAGSYFDFKNFRRSSLLSYITTSLVIIGLVIGFIQLFTNAKPLLLPFNTAWAIAVDSFKNWRLFLFGVGSSSFLDAFSQFRPMGYNLGNLWNVRFIYSSNYYLQLLTTVGILGLGTFIWVIVNVIKTHLALQKKEKEENLIVFIPLLVIFVVLFFIFHNFLLLFLLYLLLAAFSLNLPVKKEFSESSKIAVWSIFIPVTLVVLAFFYFLGRAYVADVYLKKSLVAMAQNDGNNTYNYQIKAIALNPFNDTYRLYYSQTNLALAYALAQKTDISDQDRQTITTLVQQAINEAKTAVSLNKNKVTNWENLAGIYRQLINFAEGSDQWAITSLSQAIKLDPVSPSLRLTLGGVYYALGNFDEAIRYFQQTIDLKPNFANGYYNLSAAYREKGDFKKANEAMNTVLSLLPISSEDYQKAYKEATDLAKQMNIEEASGSASPSQQEAQAQETPLLGPEPLPSPVITPPIQLPEDSASPEGANSQTLPGGIPQQEINPSPSATN